MSSFVLRIIALVTMIIDHTGAVLFPDQVWLRCIGRIAFPLYIFLIAQGCKHTRSMEKYMLRLLVFAVVSEIPYDLAVGTPSALWNFAQQNVFWTLLFGVAALWACRFLEKKGVPAYLSWLVVLPIAFGADLLHTDYSSLGVLAVFATARMNNKYLQWLCLAAFIVIQYYSNWIVLLSGALALIPIILYNGQPGPRKLKFAFYAAYPAHLLILAALAAIL